MVVTPNQTITYSLSATNGVSAVNAQTTITVTTSIDTQPPTTPNLTSAVAKSATEVDLTWTASTDNVGVAGYQVLRNGVLLRSLGSGSLGFADTTVSANTTYTYAIKAFDAAGNTSLSSNSIQATTSSTPAVTTCPVPAVNAFTGCYYNNTDLLGNPSLVRTDNQIDFSWGNGSPSSAVTPLNFSVRWQGMFNFNAGDYTFSAMMSDGFRLYIDGVPIRFAWRDQTPNTYVNVLTLTQGNHLVTIEYYEDTGSARALLSWTSASSAPGPAPVINSFTGTPATLTAGQSANLSWNVTGATGVTVNGTSVSSTGSMAVTPAQTTTYVLSATNRTSTITAQSVITVSAAADTQAPTTPALISAVAKSASEVDLAWTASTDNVGVAGYQIIRNGVALNTVASNSLGYADTTVGANTTYSYVIQAFDAAGNHSLSSNSMQATTLSAPALTTCPGPAVGAFTGCYYNNTDLLGNPSLVRADNQINFNWGDAAPGSGVTAGNFSVRWQGIFNFNAGDYTFSAMMSDGFRLYIDGVPLRSAWRDLSPSLFLVPQALTQGNHLITLEYYEHTGTGVASLSWQKN
jgi:chitodextrinase